MLSILAIQYFLAVVESGGITKAAQELYVSQPAVSKQIAFLEQELQTKLFYRFGGALKLTDQGNVYYNFFASTRKKFLRISQDLQNAKSTIRIGYHNKWAISDKLDRFAAQIQREFPQKEIIFYPWDAEVIFNTFSFGNVDMILCKQDALSMVTDPPPTEIYPVIEIPAVIAYKDPNHSGEKSTDISSFRDTTLCSMTPRGPIIHSRVTEEVCSFYGISPKIINVPTLDAVILYLNKHPSAATVTDAWSAQADPTFSYFVTDVKMPVSLVWQSSNKNAEYTLIAQRLKDFFLTNE